MKPNNTTELRRIRLRLKRLRRSVDGRHQTRAERDREEGEKRKAGTAGVGAGAGAYVMSRPGASKIKTLTPKGIEKIAKTVKNVPLRGSRILTGGALAEALRNMR